MDTTMAIVIVVAAIVIITVTLILNPFGGESTVVKTAASEAAVASEEAKTSKPTETDEDKPVIGTPIHIDQSEIDNIIKPKVSGNCTLYKHVAKNEFKCFGIAGNFSLMATNEYRPAQSEDYFCRPTAYGCKLYQTVNYKLG